MPDSTLLKAGSFLPHGVMTSEWVKSSLRNGTIEACGVNANAESQYLMAASDMPGFEKMAPVPMAPPGEGGDGALLVGVRREGSASTVSISGGSVTTKTETDLSIKTATDKDGNPLTMETKSGTEQAPEVRKTAGGSLFSNSGSAISKWNLDPESLKDKTLEQLNVTIFELGYEGEPFTVLEEARGWLTQDFQPDDGA